MSNAIKCEIYRYYADTLYLHEILSLFIEDTIKEDTCKKAQFYFEHLCSKCEVNPINQNGEIVNVSNRY